MPANRIGFSTDFNLTNSKVGIGTTNPRATLDVVGTLKGDFNISGVTTLTSYAGFIPQKQSGDGVTITGEVNTISEDIIVNVGETFIVSSGSTISIGTLESISIGAHLSVPNGGITLRPQDPIEGTVRFNDDLNTLEFYNGVEWRQFTVTGASGRGVFGGGASPSMSSKIDFVNISTTGNALNFGDLTAARFNISSCSSSIRGVFGGGSSPVSYQNVIDYVTIASEGNAIDFGDLLGGSSLRAYMSACSSSTRGLFGGGYQGVPSPSVLTVNIIEYITINTLGNALDFGDLFTGRYTSGSCSSSTRGLWGGGTGVGPTFSLQKSIEFVTISSTGNAISFGDLTQTKTKSSGCSNSVRGLFMGGSTPSTSVYINTIEFVTIASTGNSLTFGDLTQSRGRGGCCSTSIRGVLGGGETPSVQNTIDYITITSTGNSQDFGDLTLARRALAACSDSHGGLGGF